jgi:hypothetical protein
VIARLRHDAHDRILYEQLGKPLTFTLERHGLPQGSRLVAFTMPAPRVDGLSGWRFEAEAEWPPLAQQGGFAVPAWASDSCASEGQVLRVTPSEGATAHIRIALPVPEGAGRFNLAPRFRATGAKGHAEIRVSDVVFQFDDAIAKPIGGDCITLPAMPVPLDGRVGKEADLFVDVSGAPIDLDAVTLRP